MLLPGFKSVDHRSLLLLVCLLLLQSAQRGFMASGVFGDLLRKVLVLGLVVENQVPLGVEHTRWRLRV